MHQDRLSSRILLIKPSMIIHEDALKFYHAVLMTTKIGEAARAYLYERGMTDDLLKTFQIGLAPDEPDYLYQSVIKKI